MWRWSQWKVAEKPAALPPPIDTRVHALALANARVSELLRDGGALNQEFLDFRRRHHAVLDAMGRLVRVESQDIHGKQRAQAALDTLLKRGQQWTVDFAQALKAQAEAKKAVTI